jgi:hypothetical protein
MQGLSTAGEGCAGWLNIQGKAGALPSSKAGFSFKSDLDRNTAPTAGGPSSDGKAYGTFKYTVYDPPEGHPVYNKPMPDWTWKNNSLFSFWNDPLSHAPGGVGYKNDINKTYANAKTAVVQMFHGGLWGGWTFQVATQDVQTQSLLFSHGGYQEARGAGGGKHYYVENVLEELDSPGEWFYDPVKSQLHFWPNSTDGTAGKEVVAPLLSALVRVEGAKGVSFEGFTMTETRATFLEQYEVPSGGDCAPNEFPPPSSL